MAVRHAVALLLIGAAAPLAGCSGGPSLPDLQQLPAQATTVQVGPTEAYTRIAQAAMACWLGAQGRLVGSYLFHADADPPSRGGGAEITIHERVYDQPKPWGYKAFRIALTAGGGYTSIALENLRMPEPLAEEMRAEVLAWARGSSSCIGETMTGPGAPLVPTPVINMNPFPRN